MIKISKRDIIHSLVVGIIIALIVLYKSDIYNALAAGTIFIFSALITGGLYELRTKIGNILLIIVGTISFSAFRYTLYHEMSIFLIMTSFVVVVILYYLSRKRDNKSQT